MKKLLLFLLTFVATTVAATADEVTFDFKNNEYGLTRQTDSNAPYIDNGTVCQNGAVTMTLFKASGKYGMRLWNDGLRFYRNSTAGFTLSVANGTINSVKITKASDAKFTKEGTATVATSWTNINASEVKFNYSSEKNAALWTVKVTYTPGTSGPELTTATLSFPEKEYSLTLGDEFTAPVLIADPVDALNEVKYSSTQEQIATVDETTGVVTILAVGQTTIRAAISGSETYYDTYAEYTLNVNKPVVEGEKTEAFDFSKQGYSNAEELTEVKVNDYITLYFSIGSNDSHSPKYYDTGNAARLYGGNTLNVKGTNAVITSVTFITTDGNKLHRESAASKGTLDVAGQTWTGQTKSVTFTQGGTSGHARVQKLEITYILTPAFPKIDGMTEAGTNMPIEAGVTVLTVEVGEGENLHVHEYFGEAQGAPKKISPVVCEDDIDVTTEAWRHLNPDGSVSVEYTVPANVKELHFVAEKKGLVSTPLSLMINEDGTATGIEDIEAAEAEGATEWYTLQGVRVSAPAAAGLYIRRTAGTVEKVLVK